MATLIDDETIQKYVLEVLTKDMTDTLDIVTDQVIERMKATVKANVAARMIALVQSDYSMQYDRHELIIKVKI